MNVEGTAVQNDTAPTIQELIGDKALLLQLAKSCNDLAASAIKLESMLRMENPQAGNVDKVNKEIHNNWNMVAMICEYLGIKTSTYTQALQIYNWHLRLIKTGIDKTRSEKDMANERRGC